MSTELQQELSRVLPLEEEQLKQTLSYADTLPDSEAAEHFRGLLGDSPQAVQFIGAYMATRAKPTNPGVNVYDTEPRTLMDQPPAGSAQAANGDSEQRSSTSKDGLPPAYAPPPGPPPSSGIANGDSKHPPPSSFAPPSGPPPSSSTANGQDQRRSSISKHPPPSGFAPPSGPPPASSSGRLAARNHTNAVIEAAKVRARDEQEMQQMLQNLQYEYGIYNSDIEPEHDTDYPCNCSIHQYQRRKWNRYGVQEMWSKAVMYPGEKAYNDNNFGPNSGLFNTNPYKWKTVSPYGYNQVTWGAPPKPKASWHAKSIHQTISLNNSLNREAQAKVDSKEPSQSIWEDTDEMEPEFSKMTIDDKKQQPSKATDGKLSKGKGSDEKRLSLVPLTKASSEKPKLSKFQSMKKSIGMKTSDEKAASHASGLRESILEEESGRWPDEQWRYLVEVYQDKVGMTKKIAQLRAHSPIQYLHLLRAGFFEPIPVAWANQASNPLKFSIEASAGWRGLTPAWRGYEDTAEERLYWVLNHREGSVGMRMKPDFISEMNMARERMAKAVDPPPLYFSAQDTCHLQHTSEGYSKQVMPPPFRPFDRPEVPTDDTMILLDVSGSMDFDPVRPVYDQYLVTRFARSTQPKNKGKLIAKDCRPITY